MPSIWSWTRSVDDALEVVCLRAVEVHDHDRRHHRRDQQEEEQQRQEAREAARRRRAGGAGAAARAARRCARRLGARAPLGRARRAAGAGRVARVAAESCAAAAPPGWRRSRAASAAVSSSTRDARSRGRAAPPRIASRISDALRVAVLGVARAPGDRAHERGSSSGPTSGFSRLSGSASPSCWRSASSVSEPVSYGSRPASSWYRTTPSEYTSELAVASSPRARSGER